MGNFCCEYWPVLALELQGRLNASLADAKPAYLAKPLLQMLHYINTYCPVCGARLDETVDSKPESIPPVSPVSKCPSPHQASSHTEQTITIKCPSCNGKGTLGSGENEVPIICNTCAAQGTITKTSQVDPERLADLDALRAKVVTRTKPKEAPGE